MEMAVRDAQYLVEDFAGSSVFKRIENRLHDYFLKTANAENSIERSMLRVLKEQKLRLNSLEAHTKSIHPLLPLQRGFALLKSGGEIITNQKSLQSFKNIEIIRHMETAEAEITNVLKTTENTISNEK
ncbi:hypothetical protein, partial [Clavibacter michiganensis]|uniref:hypothetical protein n=1 Tax=Clavibacter michiganensis TaxID=28447 RepID=UPI0029305FA3